MKLSDILNEVLKNIDEIDVDSSKIQLRVAKIVEYDFSIDGLNYRCTFRPSVFGESTTMVHVKFLLMNNPKSPTRKDIDSEESYQVALDRSRVGVTGTGNAFHVFGHVLSALKKYTEEYSPDYITFSGDEHHVDLYSSLIKYLGKKFPAYQISNVDPTTNDEPTVGEFWLKRKIA